LEVWEVLVVSVVLVVEILLLPSKEVAVAVVAVFSS
jgi:hypothetical protein